MNIRKFAKLRDGRDVMAVRLTNSYGAYADILNYGATIRSIVVQDRDGNMSDVVLGAAEGEPPDTARFQGAIMGRCANRIAEGCFQLDGRFYQLVIPDPERSPHFLHGGAGGYNHQLFEFLPSKNSHSVTLAHYDTGEDGWDCGVHTKITYTLTDEQALHIDYCLIPEEATLLSPTNHVYFNLNFPNSILSTQVTINTDTYVPKGISGVPEGQLQSLLGTPLDFTERRSFLTGLSSKKTEEFLDWHHYDDVYFLGPCSFRKVAEAWCPENGRLLEVYTDQSALILFTPAPKASVTNKGYHLDSFPAFCMETQYVPNAINCNNYPIPVFRKGDAFYSRTTYKFSIR